MVLDQNGQKDFDILVIGGGPGGYVSAIRAAQLGAKTALIEKGDLGGTCLNRGCIPTKTLLTSAEKIAELKNMEEFGVKISGFEIDFKRIVKRKDSVIRRLRGGVKTLLKENSVKVFQGAAAFIDNHHVSLDTGENIYAEKIIIATGSVPKRIKLGDNKKNVIYSEDLLNIQELPENLVIVGGGVIGVEFASIFNSLGVKVTILELMDSILPQIDKEISNLLAKILKQKGINIYTSAKVLDIEEVGGFSNVIFERSGTKQEVLSDKVLMALGRISYTEGLNLDAAGIQYDVNGIKIGKNSMTNVEHIYAIGDVTGGTQLAHYASAQGSAVAEHALGHKSYSCLKYIPACIYTQPEVASVGLTEKQMQKNGTHYQIARFPLSASGKALAMGSTDGMFKILHDPQTGEIFGVHLIGPRVTDIIGEACLAMRAELTVGDIATTIHAHPTIAEALMETAHIAKRAPIHWKD